MKSKQLTSIIRLLLLSTVLAACSITISPTQAPTLTPATNEIDETPIPSETRSAAAPVLTATLPVLPTPGLTPSDQALPFETDPTPTQAGTQIYQSFGCEQDGCFYSTHQILLRPIPVGNNLNVDTTYRYGSTQRGAREVHHGVEFVNPTGTPVIAAEGGVVEFAGNDYSQTQGGSLGFYGNLVILKHQIDGWDEPVFTLYAHLSKILVEAGQPVERGEQIGEVGKTGSAGGSHLHFEVRLGVNQKRNSVNPELWLEPLNDGEKSGTLVLRLNHKGSTVYSVDIDLLDYSDPDSNYHKATYAETYALGGHPDPFFNENLVMGDLAPGVYRVSFTRTGRIYQKYVEIEPERITLVEFDIDF